MNIDLLDRAIQIKFQLSACSEAIRQLDEEHVADDGCLSNGETHITILDGESGCLKDAVAAMKVVIEAHKVSLKEEIESW